MTPEEKAPILSFVEATEKLREVLETWPTNLGFRARIKHWEISNASKVWAESIPTVKQISSHCWNCGFHSLWEAVDTGSSGISKVIQYKCKNCERGYRYFALASVRLADGEWQIFKIGQYPEVETKPAKEVQTYLNSEEYGFYRKALRLRNSGDGIGAVSYLRRIIESRMDEILGLVAEAVQDSGGNAEGLARIETARRSTRFDDKVSVANDLLPKYLRPEGLPNPFDIFHDLTSEGLHRRTEEECIQIFDKCRLAFELFFKRLKVHKEEARTYVEELKKLTVKRDKSG